MSWPLRSLSDVAIVLGGQSPPGAAVEDREGGLPFFQGKAEFGQVSPTPRKWCAAPPRVAEAGDLLLSIRAPVGPVNRAATRCGIGRGLAALRPSEAVSADWLAYWLQHTSPILRRKATGSTFEAITIGVVRDHPVPVPPRDAQSVITAALDTHFSRLDAALASLTRVKSAVANARASVLRAAVEGRLVPTEADLAARASRTTESATSLLSQVLDWRRRMWAADSPRRAYVEPQLPINPREVALPAGWTWASMDQLLAGIEAGKSFAADGKRPQGDQVGILKVSAVTWGVYDEDESKTVHDPDMVEPDYFVREGDLLFSRANTKELVGMVVVAQRVTRRVMLSDKILRLHVEPRLRMWILWALRAQHARTQIERLATGNQTSMWNIGQDRLRSICIPLPPLAEQGRILSELDRRMSVLDEIERTTSAGLARSQLLRQAILKRAFDGGLAPARPNGVASALHDDGPAEVVR